MTNNKGVRVNTEGNCYADLYVSLAQITVWTSIIDKMLEENIGVTCKVEPSTAKSDVSTSLNVFKKMKYISEKMKLKLERVAYDTRGRYVIKYLLSSWMKELKHDIRVDDIIRNTRTKNKKNYSDKMFEYYMKKDELLDEQMNNTPEKKIKRMRGVSDYSLQQRASKRVKLEFNDIQIPVPSNGKILSKKEMVEFYKKEVQNNSEIKRTTLYKALRDHNPPRIACSLRTFERTIEQYINTGLVPSEHEDGVTRGRPTLMPKTELNILNSKIDAYPGVTANTEDIRKDLVKYNNQKNPHKHLQEVSYQTAVCYSLQSSLCNKDISVIASNKTMIKCTRRQMASMSVRNCMSHIAAIAYSHFHPRSDTYSVPKGLSEGSKTFTNIL